MRDGRCFLSNPPTGSPRAWRSWSFSAKDSEGQSTHAYGPTQNFLHTRVRSRLPFIRVRGIMEIGEIQNSIDNINVRDLNNLFKVLLLFQIYRISFRYIGFLDLRKLDKNALFSTYLFFTITSRNISPVATCLHKNSSASRRSPTNALEIERWSWGATEWRAHDRTRISY